MEIAKKLIAIAKQMGYQFSFKGRPISYAEIFSDVGLLPALTKRADQLCSLCLGYGLGATFEDDERSLLGSKVTFDNFTPDVLRLLCITDVLHELVKTSSSADIVSLDELSYD